MKKYLVILFNPMPCEKFLETLQQFLHGETKITVSNPPAIGIHMFSLMSQAELPEIQEKLIPTRHSYLVLDITSPDGHCSQIPQDAYIMMMHPDVVNNAAGIEVNMEEAPAPTKTLTVNDLLDMANEAGGVDKLSDDLQQKLKELAS